jgi:hypothetical protein
VSQWILLHCGYSGRGGPAIAININSARKLVSLVPTPPTSDGKIPPLPLLDMPWAEWIDYTETSISQISEPPSEQAMFIKQTEDLIAEEKTPAIPLPALQVIVNKSQTASIEEANLVAAALDIPVGSNLAMRTCLSLTNIPPAAVHAPTLTPLEYAFVMGTNATKVAIALEIAKQEKQRKLSLLAACQKTLEEWDARIEILTDQQQVLIDWEQYMNQYTSIFHDQGAYIDGVESKVKEAKASGNPYLTKKLDEQLARSKERNLKLAALQSPHSSPAVVPQRYCPLSTLLT